MFQPRIRQSAFVRFVSALICLTFTFTSVTPPDTYAQILPQPATILNLPIPGSMVNQTPQYMPTLIRGIKLDYENPLRFDFIVDRGESGLYDEEFKEESHKLIKYFLASLTTPEEEIWVNLSPYERDRIVPQSFGQTEMGRDLLAQDYILKQLTASLMYPEEELGEKFWNRVYQKAEQQFGSTDIPMNTFNKVWIVPDAATVYEHEGAAFVVQSHLKVMLEEDYYALTQSGNSNDENVLTGVTADVVREILIPEIEREVNSGENFASLRQIYQSLILATWYKKRLRESLLGQVYVDQNKVKGVDVADKQINEKIYEQYLAAFEKGVYNFIREEYDPVSDQLIPRKYFSGGFTTANADGAMLVDRLEVFDLASLSEASLEIQNTVSRFMDEMDAAQASDDLVFVNTLLNENKKEVDFAMAQAKADLTDVALAEADLSAVARSAESDQAMGSEIGDLVENLENDLAMISRRALIISTAKGFAIAALPALNANAAAETLNSQQIQNLLREHIQYVINTGEGYANTSNRDAWKRLLYSLYRARKDYNVDIAPFMTNDENLGQFIDLYIEIFQQAKRETGSPYWDSPINHRKMLELLGGNPSSQYMHDPSSSNQEQLKEFFASTWSNYIVLSSQRPQVADALGKALVQVAKDIDNELAIMMQFVISANGNKITPNSAKAINDRWQEFNNTYMIPNGMYGYFSLDTSGQIFSVIYEIEQQEASPELDRLGLSVVYGNKIDRVNTAGSEGHSILGSKVVFVDNQDVNETEQKILDVLSGDPYILIEQNGIHAPSITNWIRNTFGKRLSMSIREQMRRTTRNHELAHKFKEIQNISYAQNDRFGLSQQIWNQQTDGFKQSVEEETAAYLGEMVTAEEPGWILVYILPQLLTGMGVPNYFAARYIFNNLAERDQEDWVDWRNANEVLEVAMDLLNDPNLQSKAERLFVKGFPGLARTLPQYTDFAMGTDSDQAMGSVEDIYQEFKNRLKQREERITSEILIEEVIQLLEELAESPGDSIRQDTMFLSARLKWVDLNNPIVGQREIERIVYEYINEMRGDRMVRIPSPWEGRDQAMGTEAMSRRKFMQGLATTGLAAFKVLGVGGIFAGGYFARDFERWAEYEKGRDRYIETSYRAKVTPSVYQLPRERVQAELLVWSRQIASFDQRFMERLIQANQDNVVASSFAFVLMYSSSENERRMALDALRLIGENTQDAKALNNIIFDLGHTERGSMPQEMYTEAQALAQYLITGGRYVYEEALMAKLNGNEVYQQYYDTFADILEKDPLYVSHRKTVQEVMKKFPYRGGAVRLIDEEYREDLERRVTDLGIPLQLFYRFIEGIPQVESNGGDPRFLESSAGAYGPMQTKEGAFRDAVRIGKLNYDVKTDIFDFVKNTTAGAYYFMDMLRQVKENETDYMPVRTDIRPRVDADFDLIGKGNGEDNILLSLTGLLAYKAGPGRVKRLEDVQEVDLTYLEKVSNYVATLTTDYPVFTHNTFDLPSLGESADAAQLSRARTRWTVDQILKKNNFNWLNLPDNLHVQRYNDIRFQTRGFRDLADSYTIALRQLAVDLTRDPDVIHDWHFESPLHILTLKKLDGAPRTPDYYNRHETFHTMAGYDLNLVRDYFNRSEARTELKQTMMRYKATVNKYRERFQGESIQMLEPADYEQYVDSLLEAAKDMKTFQKFIALQEEAATSVPAVSQLTDVQFFALSGQALTIVGDMLGFAFDEDEEFASKKVIATDRTFMMEWGIFDAAMGVVKDQLSQEAIQEKIDELNPERTAYVKKPILLYEIASSNPEEIPSSIRDFIGDVDETEYSPEFIETLSQPGNYIVLQFDGFERDFYLISEEDYNWIYDPIDRSEVQEKNASLVDKLNAIEEIADFMQDRPDQFISVRKKKADNLIRLSDIEISILTSFSIENADETQTKKTGKDAFLNFNERQQEWYLINADENGEPIGYERNTVQIAQGQFDKTISDAAMSEDNFFSGSPYLELNDKLDQFDVRMPRQRSLEERRMFRDYLEHFEGELAQLLMGYISLVRESTPDKQRLFFNRHAIDPVTGDTEYGYGDPIFEGEEQKGAYQNMIFHLKKEGEYEAFMRIIGKAVYVMDVRMPSVPRGSSMDDNLAIEREYMESLARTQFFTSEEDMDAEFGGFISLQRRSDAAMTFSPEELNQIDLDIEHFREVVIELGPDLKDLLDGVKDQIDGLSEAITDRDEGLFEFLKDSIANDIKSRASYERQHVDPEREIIQSTVDHYFNNRISISLGYSAMTELDVDPETLYRRMEQIEESLSFLNEMLDGLEAVESLEGYVFGEDQSVPDTALSFAFLTKESLDDEAMVTSEVQKEVVSTEEFTKGGIDFNPDLLDLQIKRDDNGAPLPMKQQSIDNINIDGFIPVIINISPVPNIPLLMGQPFEDVDTVPVDTAQDDAYIREEISYLP